MNPFENIRNLERKRDGLRSFALCAFILTESTAYLASQYAGTVPEMITFTLGAAGIELTSILVYGIFQTSREIKAASQNILNTFTDWSVIDSTDQM